MINQGDQFNKCPRNRRFFPRLANGWIVEGFFYATFIAFIWPGEEPSKFNTLLAAWSAYAIVAFALHRAVKSGTVINPTKWIRLYFIQSILLIIAVPVAIVSILALVGGVYALQRKRWGLALAGSIAAILASVPLLGTLPVGISATTMIALAKDELE